MTSDKQHGKKILICDDEESIRESLKLILEDAYELIVTDSGAQCLDCIANDPHIGLVLLDIKMPQVNGLDVLKAIKNRRPALPTVMVTGYQSMETISEATKRGASGYLVKPFETADVLEKVRPYVGQ